MSSCDSDQTQCHLLCDESPEVLGAVYHASAFCQYDTSSSNLDVALDITSTSDNSDSPDGSDGSDIAVPHDAEVPKDVFWETENIAVTGNLKVLFSESLTNVQPSDLSR